MFSTDLDMIKLVLFAVSNLAADRKGSQVVLEDSYMIERCLDLMRNKNTAIQTEASFVVANAINKCDLETLCEFWDQYRDELVQSLVFYL